MLAMVEYLRHCIISRVAVGMGIPMGIPIPMGWEWEWERFFPCGDPHRNSHGNPHGNPHRNPHGNPHGIFEYGFIRSSLINIGFTIDTNLL